MSTNNITKLDEHRPHLHIDAGEKQHVYPVSYFKDIAKGETVLEPIPPDVLRVIVREWLMSLGIYVE
jgi:hypothetical protein